MVNGLPSLLGIAPTTCFFMPETLCPVLILRPFIKSAQDPCCGGKTLFASVLCGRLFFLWGIAEAPGGQRERFRLIIVAAYKGFQVFSFSV